MKLKSFFADTVEQALTLARAEMGPDAMLVHSKRSGQEARHLGAYEVVCAAATEAAAAPESSLSFRSTATMPQTDRLVEDVSELKQQMERLARSLARCGSGMTGIRQDPELAQAFATLAEADLDGDLAYEIIG